MVPPAASACRAAAASAIRHDPADQRHQAALGAEPADLDHGLLHPLGLARDVQAHVDPDDRPVAQQGPVEPRGLDLAAGESHDQVAAAEGHVALGILERSAPDRVEHDVRPAPAARRLPRRVWACGAA